MSAVYTRHLVQAEDLYESRPEPNPLWIKEAVCKDYQELFLADFEHSEIAIRRRNEQKTQAICIDCPVRLHCLWEALDTNQDHYMWGGLNPDQRRWVSRHILRKEEVA